MALSKRWAGSIYGTNTGNIFLELEQETGSKQVTGILRLMDNRFGLAIFAVQGSFQDTLLLSGKPTQQPNGQVLGDLEIEGTLTSDGSVRGTWKTSIGTAGTFVAFPHDHSQAKAANSASPAPEQVFSSVRQIGALRLYADAISELARFMRGEFAGGRPIVTYSIRGNEMTRYLEDFEREAPQLGELRRFKFHIQEPEAHGILKMVTVDLNSFGKNEIRVQGINESWVIGKAEAISRLLEPYESSLVTGYKKFGLTLNQLIFFAMLVLMPAIADLKYRAGFAVVVIALLEFLVWFHTQFIPVLIVYPANARPSTFARLKPSLVSWLIAASSAVAASYIFAYLTAK